METNEEIQILDRMVRAGIKAIKMLDMDANVEFFIKEGIDPSDCENIALNVHTNNYIAHLYVTYNGDIIIEDFAYRGRLDKSKYEPIILAYYRIISSILSFGLYSMINQNNKNTTT